MLEAISKTEKADLLLMLALAFDKKFSENADDPAVRDVSTLSEKYFKTFSGDDAKKLQARIEYFERLQPEKRRHWQTTRLDKLRRRGLVERLDANIHPLQIAEILNREPREIQLLVLKNLPDVLGRRVAESLRTKISAADFSVEKTNSNQQVSDEIVALVRREFVSNFIALEDVFESFDTDKIPIQKFEGFIRHLGIRETAIACRGISSKETLAAFLNRFDEQSAKEIAENVAHLENVKPFWVERADRLLRKTLENQFQPETLLRSLGFKILAIAFIRRDQSARKYTAQKMMPFEAENWYELIAESEQEYRESAENERQILDRRRRVVERIAANFI